MENKAIKFRIYPTSEQRIMFAKTFGCCRKVFNLMLADKIHSYEETKTFGKQTPAMYKEKYPYLKEVDSLALANAQRNLERAFKNCFSSKHCKFPKFKSNKGSRKSYTTNNQKGTIEVCEKSIKLPKIGKVKAVIHRTPSDEWKLKSATISQDSDGKYYISVLYEYSIDIIPVSKDTTNSIGLDYKSDGLYMDSNGSIGSNHKYYRISQKQLARAQRILARRQGSKKGEVKSKNYLKQQRKVGKIYKHTANQRKDNLHKTSTEIANQYDVVCVEDLNMKALANKGFGNGKSTCDNGYGLLLTMLNYKLENRGKYFIKVGKWYPSSQICNCCGSKQKLKLSDRIYSCSCGYVGSRDKNAAINILREGMRILKEKA